jgi:ABC-2 type transport system permease protein
MRVLREAWKHVRIYGMLVRMNVMSQMEYRTNFVTGILMELGYMIGKVLYVVVTYRAGRSIAGFTPDEVLVFVGTFVTATGFYAGVFASNLWQLPQLVSDGTFDTLMVKPVSLQFLASLRRSDIGVFLTDVAAGIVLTAVGLSRLGTAMDIWRVGAYALFVASGAAVGYALYIIPQSLVFRMIKSQALIELLDAFWDFNNVPMVAYERVGRAVGTYVIPVFVVTSFPALFALGKLTPLQIAWGAAAPVVFLTVACLCWRAGVKNYSSASG